MLAEAFDRLRPAPRLTFDGADGLRALEVRLLGEEQRRYAEALRRAAAGRTVLLDTGFIGPLTYTTALARMDPRLRGVAEDLCDRARRALARGAWGMADRTVYLDLPERLARDRARRSPAAHPAALRDRHAEVGRWERRFWIEVYGPASDGRLIVLDARRRVPVLLGELDRRFGRAAPPSAAEPPGRRDRPAAPRPSLPAGRSTRRRRSRPGRSPRRPLHRSARPMR